MPRGASKLHGALRVGFVHVQRRFDVHRRGERVSDDNDFGDVREGRARVRVRIGIDAVHRRRVQRRSVLHQRVHCRVQSVRNGGRADVRNAIQWVHRMGKCGGLSRHGTGLQRGRILRSIDPVFELPSQRGGYDKLRSGKRELLHEFGGDGGDVRADVHH
jgi:hypothetical protein